MLAAAASASAATTISFRLAAHGIATGARPRMSTAVLATSPKSARPIVVDVPAAAARVARNLNYRKSVLVGVFGSFGCTDARVHVSRIVEQGRTLIVRLVVKPIAPGTAECMAIYTTYRLLVVPRSALKQVPTAAKVTVARA
jgi:hypothetical protein